MYSFISMTIIYSKPSSCLLCTIVTTPNWSQWFLSAYDLFSAQQRKWSFIDKLDHIIPCSKISPGFSVPRRKFSLLSWPILPYLSLVGHLVSMLLDLTLPHHPSSPWKTKLMPALGTLYLFLSLQEMLAPQVSPFWLLPFRSQKNVTSSEYYNSF